MTKKNISWHGWPQFAAQLLQIPQKYQVEANHIHVMAFASVALFSVTYLGLLIKLLESAKLNKL